MNDKKLLSPKIMGILNVTPDSFYDGGEYDHAETATQRAAQMIEQGADIIDIGGQSTLEVEEVSVETELERVIPVIEEIQKYKNTKMPKSKQDFCISGLSHFCISIDTYKPEVARAALAAGANIVNDVTGGRGSETMFPLIAEYECMYVLMHSKDEVAPAKIRAVEYQDVMQVIKEFFITQLQKAEVTGVKREQIILDPGLGHFISSDPKYSWEILERLEELAEFGCPILVSPSRKSFTAGSSNLPPAERLPETLRATEIAMRHGASIVRTHDVLETKKLVDRG